MAPRARRRSTWHLTNRLQNRPLLLMGEAVDVESAAKSQARYPWEGDVLLNFDALVSDSFSLDFEMCAGTMYVT